MSVMDAYQSAQDEAPQTSSHVVLYARPKDGTPNEKSVRSFFPALNMVLSFHSILATTHYDLKKFPDVTSETFTAVAMALGEAIDTTVPPYFISLEYCDDKSMAKLVREYAAGKHTIGTDKQSVAAQIAACALATVVDKAADIPA